MWCHLTEAHKLLLHGEGQVYIYIYHITTNSGCCNHMAAGPEQFQITSGVVNPSYVSMLGMILPYSHAKGFAPQM